MIDSDKKEPKWKQSADEGDVKHPSPLLERIGMPEVQKGLVEDVQRDQGKQEGIEDHSPGRISVHASFAQKCICRKAEGRGQTCKDAQPVHVKQLEAVSPHHQIAACQ